MIDLQEYDEVKLKYYSQIKLTRSKYLTNLFTENKHDLKYVNKLVNRLTGNHAEAVLPSNNDNQLQNKMGSFFEEKTQSIRNEIETRRTSDKSQNLNNISDENCCKTSFSAFESVSTITLKNTIPTNLVKRCDSVIFPVIKDIVNSSLEEGVFPTILKHSVVKPKIKDVNGNADDLKNYRP